MTPHEITVCKYLVKREGSNARLMLVIKNDKIARDKICFADEKLVRKIIQFKSSPPLNKVACQFSADVKTDFTFCTKIKRSQNSFKVHFLILSFGLNMKKKLVKKCCSTWKIYGCENKSLGCSEKLTPYQ